MDMKNPHAVALGKLGGEARANSTSPEMRKEWARLGGLARAERHSKAELSKWGKKGGRPPKAQKKAR
jgi:general stress protein YciG